MIIYEAFNASVIGRRKQRMAAGTAPNNPRDSPATSPVATVAVSRTNPNAPRLIRIATPSSKTSDKADPINAPIAEMSSDSWMKLSTTALRE